MPETTTISQTSFPDYLSWEKLRMAGIEHLEELGTELWTDFNLHDPGITILEVLCYALTDLGYRTNLPIEDILASSPEEDAAEDNFFTAREILSCNPVTINDFRKLLIDVKGVKNAWLEVTDQSEVPIYVNAERCQLQYDALPALPSNSEAPISARLPLGGLYNVCLDIDESTDVDACGHPATRIDKIVERVRCVLHQHRNLCDDFLDIVVLGDEEIAICAEVELTSEANPERILLEIYRTVQDYLSPPLRFYTLGEMLAKGKSVDEVFAGRPLQAESNGFLDEDELEKTELRTAIHASDVYRVIMDVEGVKAIEKLVLTNYVNGIAQTNGEEWCLQLTSKHRPVLDLKRSKITFTKGGLRFGVNAKRAAQEYQEIRAARTKTPLSAYDLDLPIPQGRRRDLLDYRSVSHEFPLVYGIGEFGPDLSGLTPAQRQTRTAQSRQLRAYLFFFDQILINYIAQLAHVRHLFSNRSAKELLQASAKHTYFTQMVADVPEFEELIHEGDGAMPFAEYVPHIAESTKTYNDRRNRFLDHLLARFAESFSAYVLLMYQVSGERHEDERIIEDKTRFLQQYPDISRNRGKGFDYCGPTHCCESQEGGTGPSADAANNEPFWNSTNVAGLKKRASLLLGIDDVRRQTLAHCEVVEVNGRYTFQLAQGDRLLAVSSRDYADRTSAAAAFEAIRERAGEARHYRRLAFDGFNHFGFRVTGEDGSGLAEYPQLFAEREARAAARNEVRRQLNEEGPSAVRTELRGERHQFVIDVRPGGPTIQGSASFREQPDALRAAEDFLAAAKDDARYQDFLRSGFTHYGFALLDEGGQPVLQAPRLWPTTSSRDAALVALLAYARFPALTCTVIRAHECIFYVLYDAAYNADEDDPDPHTLLVSARGFPSEGEAEAAFDAVLMPLAADVTNYRRDQTDEGFGFVLFDPDSGDEIARHPKRYPTRQERNDRLLTIVLYVGDVPVQHSTPGTEGEFTYEILDSDGEVQLESALVYPTKGKAEGACRAAIRLARYRAYYRTRNDLPGSSKLGFELIDRDGNLVATHPGRFRKDSTRDKALDQLIDKAEQADQGALVCGPPKGMEGEFTFELYLGERGGTQRTLFRSAETFPEKELAEEAYQAFVMLAREKVNYFLRDDMSFDIREPVDEETWGAPVAVHPRVYVSEAERYAAIALIRTYLRDDPVLRGPINPEGSYFLELLGDEEEVELESTETYPSEVASEEAFTAFLAAAASSDSYVDTDSGPDECPYGFEVYAEAEDDTPRMLVATHPRTYSSEDRRDARKAEVAALASGTNPAQRTPGTQCGYYYMQTCAGHPFRSIHRFPNESRAARACLDAAALLADSERYSMAENGPWEGNLIIKDVTGDVVALYAGPAQSQEELAAVPGEVVAQISGVPDPEVAFVRKPSGFAFRLVTEEGWQLLRSTRLHTPVLAFSPEPYLESADARDAAIRSLVLAFQETRPEPSVTEHEGRYRYILVEVGQSVLISRSGFESEAAARRAFQALAQIGAHAENYHPFDLPEDGRYGFEVYGKNEAERARKSACEGANRLVEQAQDSGNFRRVADSNECVFGFELLSEGGTTLASQPLLYPSTEDREEEIDGIIELVGDEGLHLIEHILLRPRNPASNGGEADAFFPLDNGCLNDKGEICFLKSDPYSFRATVVLPYWPARFRDLSFRSFIEQTIRAEAPAHVYLRICWVDVCQMRALELAYRQWLRTLSCCGEDCGATKALNRLLEVLCGLRNMYPEATLAHCAGSSEEAPVILDQTLLGNANPDRDDNG